MKYNFSKKDVLKFLAHMAGIISLSIFAYLSFKMLPAAVQYSVPKQTYEEASISKTLEDEALKECRYHSYYDIREKGPFTIRSYGNEIYVFFEKDYLYHVKAKLSEFPEKDKLTISQGITANDFSELCEILSYIES